MRKIVTAVSAAALSLSMLASAVPALAVTGYDSAYAGESAFVNISPGQTQNFQVFFANTGTTTWSRGTGTQVDLATCLEDKVTCNAQDATEASWNSGWLSATRYATTVQTTTAPGSLGTFSYNVTAPVGAANGTYRFNGDLVLSTTGERIHPDGYYQDATIGTGGGGGSATITSLTPDNGSTDGGNNVVIAGSGFVCTPAFPSVSFGGTNAAVSSCGGTSVTAVAPAHAPGSVTVTVTNSGAAASNGLSYAYNDQSAPRFTGQSTSGNFVTVTFSEPVCNATAANTAPTDWTVQNVSAATPITVNSDSIPTCTAADDASVTSATLFLASSIPPGAFVEVRLNSNSATCVPSSLTSCNTNILDLSSNTIVAPQAQTATAQTPETTKPTLVSASGAVGAREIVLNFSEPVYCTGISYNDTDFAITDNNSATTDPTVDAQGVDFCSTSQQTADSSFAVHTSFALPADRTYTVTLNTETGELTDIAGNSITTGSSITFVTGAADFTPPTIVDARMVNNVGSSDFTDINDSYSLTFSEKMNGCVTAGCWIETQDQDGTQYSGAGNRMTCATNVSCSWNTAVTTLTVTVTATLTPTPGTGTTNGMQIPFNITVLNGLNDTTGNPANVLGSPDRLVDFE
jgi:IPT/TIG domain-containing protein